MDDVDCPATLTVDETEYRFLRRDAEQGYLHYYRYTPEHGDLLYIDDTDDFDVADRWFLDHGDPQHVLHEYRYNHPWETVAEIAEHDYRSLPDPEYTPDLNKGLGGSLLLVDDGDYVLPLRAKFKTVAEILASATGDEEVFVDYRPEFIELAPADALEKYQLVPELRGDTAITGARITDSVVILDRGSEEVSDQFHVDDLALH